MILLRAIYFCTLLKKLLCNTTGVDTIAKLKAILSPQRSPPQSQTLKVLSLCITPAFTIRSSASRDDGKCHKTWQKCGEASTTHSILTNSNISFGKTAFFCCHFLTL